MAHHTDCTFIRVSGSELVQKYIGEGSRMVRELFVMARFVLIFFFCVHQVQFFDFHVEMFAFLIIHVKSVSTMLLSLF